MATAHGQSRKHSWWEAWVNLFVGSSIYFLLNPFIFAVFDIRISHAQNLGVTLMYTAVSLARTYALRRAFNWLHLKGKQ